MITIFLARECLTTYEKHNCYCHHALIQMYLKLTLVVELCILICLLATIAQVLASTAISSIATAVRKGPPEV